MVRSTILDCDWRGSKTEWLDDVSSWQVGKHPYLPSAGWTKHAQLPPTEAPREPIIPLHDEEAVCSHTTPTVMDDPDSALAVLIDEWVDNVTPSCKVTGFFGVTDPKVTRKIVVDESVLLWLERTAAQEGRAVSNVLKDALNVYLGERASGYREHFSVASALLKAAEDSPERAILREQLAARLRNEPRQQSQSQGGDALAVLTRLQRARQEQSDQNAR